MCFCTSLVRFLIRQQLVRKYHTRVLFMKYSIFLLVNLVLSLLRASALFQEVFPLCLPAF